LFQTTRDNEACFHLAQAFDINISGYNFQSYITTRLPFSRVSDNSKTPQAIPHYQCRHSIFLIFMPFDSD